MRNRLFSRVGIVLFVLFLGGCAAHQQKLGSFDQKFCTGCYQESATMALSERGPESKSLDTGALLWELQAGAAMRAARNYEESNRLFDESEGILKHFDEETLAAGGIKTFGQLVVNDAACDYRGETYDGIMVNTYKALNFMAIGDMDNARIELNRADDRQRRAVELFAKNIKKQKEAIEKKKNEKGMNGEAFKKTIENPEINSLVEKKYPDLAEWKAYPDYVNPFSTYINGLYFLMEGKDSGDFNKSLDSLKRTAGMVEENSFIVQDMKLLKKIVAGKKKISQVRPTVWIIFENGLGPKKTEFRLDIPLFLKKVQYVGIALPRLEMRTMAYDYLSIFSENKKISQTKIISSMDRVIQSEFRKEYPGLVTRSVVSAFLKTYTQYEAGKKFGLLGSLAGAAYQAATTQADLRIWTSLPKEFQVARFSRPDNGVIEIYAPNGKSPLIKLNIPKQQFTIVYVKIPQMAVTPVVGFIPNTSVNIQAKVQN